MTNDASIHVQTLGTFSVSCNGRLIPVRRTKDKALVAFLSANRGRSFRRAYLANLLWGDKTEAKSKHSLSQAIYSIGRVLPGFIKSEGEQVACHESVECDVTSLSLQIEKRGIIQTIECLPGRFLEHLQLDNAKDFEDWKSALNAQLFDKLESALSHAVAQLTAEERAIQFINLNARITEWFPDLSVGEQSGTALHSSNSATIAVGVKESPPVYASSQTAELPLVGRTAQLKMLQHYFDQILSGSSQFVLVSGEAGHGKTRLVSDFLKSLTQEETLVIECRCFQAERRVGFGPIGDIIAAVPDRCFAGLEPIWAATLKDFKPRATSNGTLPNLSVDGARARLFEAVWRLFEHVSAAMPLVIFLDDVQWCDSSTRALLSYLSRRIKGSQVLFICAARAPSVFAQREQFRNWHGIHVGELAISDLRALLQTRLHEDASIDDACNRLMKLTGGHPYLVNESLHVIERDGYYALRDQVQVTKTVKHFVGSLLRSLPPKAQSLIAILAVLQRPASIALVRRVALAKDLGISLDLLVRRRVIVLRGSKISFRHDLVREAAYSRVPVFTRADIHRRAADLLRRTRKRSGEAAEHYFLAGERRFAHRYALRAVSYAENRHATDEAIYFIRLAIRAQPRAGHKWRPVLIDLLVRAHRLTEARSELSHALEQAPFEDRDAVPLILTKLEIAHELGDLHPQEIRAQLKELRQRGNLDVRSENRLLQLSIRAAYNSGAMDEVRRAVTRLRAFAADHAGTSDGDDALGFAVRAAISYSVTAADNWGESLRHAVEQSSSPEFRVRALGVLCILEYAKGRMDVAETLVRSALDEIKKTGAMNMWPTHAGHLHMLLVEQGRYEEARRLSDEFNPEAESLGAIQTLVTLAGNNACMYYDMGDFEKARQMWERARHYLARKVSVPLETQLNGLQGLCELELGHVHNAASIANGVQKRVSTLEGRMDDASHAEMLIARITHLHGDRNGAITRLRKRIQDYGDGDTSCRLRLQLELARLLRPIDKQESRNLANQVYREATAGNMRPIAERADGLLLRS